MTSLEKITVLIVAEKPSIASTLAEIIGEGRAEREVPGKGLPCFLVTQDGVSFPPLDGAKRRIEVEYRITSVAGHVYSLQFDGKYNVNRDDVDPGMLFDAGTHKVEQTGHGGSVVRHLERQAKRSHLLLLWLDCDREGENICYEVMSVVVPRLQRLTAGGAAERSLSRQRVWRARFSALTRQDVLRALSTLGQPNQLEARAVDARQELDLKLGVAMSRFQNRHFHSKYGNLNSAVLSYGPCQTPTLGAVVTRHDEIQSFVAEPFWYIAPTIGQCTSTGAVVPRETKLEWTRGRLFDQVLCNMYYARVVQAVQKAGAVTLVQVKTKPAVKSRPLPYNTVALLKTCSSALGLGPDTTMRIAEHLYISGYISYPRTESTRYPDSMDMHEALQEHAHNFVWGDYVRDVMLTAPLKRPKGGVDAGDHPPITPMRSATPRELDGNEWRVYELIARNFLGSLSQHCRYTKTSAVYGIMGETFKCTGTRVVSPGWTQIVPNMAMRDEGIVDHGTGQQVVLVSVQLLDGKTSPPRHLTESELISWMEHHGIGTDASIATHINTICTRNYVRVSSPDRQLVPTQIGVSLVHGYHRVDPDLVLPDVRKQIEIYIDHIASGKADYDQVVGHAIEVFRAKYAYFVDHVARMDELFEARFAQITKTSGKTLSKCGKCLRYMRFISSKPMRLYCPTCDETYAVPQDGEIRQFMDRTCPLDGFELLVSVAGKNPSKATRFCPYCYNNPPFEEMSTHSGCSRCVNSACSESMPRLGIFQCPDCPEAAQAMVVFDSTSKPKWRANCNQCKFVLMLPEDAHAITMTSRKCEHCATSILKVNFKKSKTPLPDGETIFSGCVFCDYVLRNLCGEALVRRVPFKPKKKKKRSDPLLRH